MGAPPSARSPARGSVCVTFGPNITRRFCELNRLRMIVRSHEVRDNGYELEHGGQLCTVFSAPNYCGEFDNAGATVRPMISATLHIHTLSSCSGTC